MRLREPHTFFVDRSFGGKLLVAALRAAGERAEAHDTHFKKNEADEAWLARAGERRWVVLSKDGRIRSRPPQYTALYDHGVGAFVFTAGQVGGAEIVSTMVGALPKMKRVLAEHDAPFIATVSRLGDVRLFVDASGLEAAKRRGRLEHL